MKKRILSLFLVGCMMLSIVACGKQEEVVTEKEPEMVTKTLTGTIIATNEDYTEITLIIESDEVVVPEAENEAETPEEVEKVVEVQPANTGDEVVEIEDAENTKDIVESTETEVVDEETVEEPTGEVEAISEDAVLISEENTELEEVVNESEKVDNSIPAYFVKVDTAKIYNADDQEVTKESLMVDVIVEVTYEVEPEKADELQTEITAKTVKILGERMAEYYVTNVAFDEEWGMYKGNSTGAYEGEVLFVLDDVFSELEFTEEDTLKITSKGAMTMSLPPQILEFKSVEILE